MHTEKDREPRSKDGNACELLAASVFLVPGLMLSPCCWRAYVMFRKSPSFGLGQLWDEIVVLLCGSVLAVVLTT